MIDRYTLPRMGKIWDDQNRFQKMLVEQCLDLFDMEKQYRETHPEIEKIERMYGVDRGSWDTEDKYLKTIRRGIEEATRGTYIEKMTEKHGYTLPRHWLFEGQHPSEDAEFYPADGDIAGALLDRTGKQPVIVSKPPDPHSFS